MTVTKLIVYVDSLAITCWYIWYIHESLTAIIGVAGKLAEAQSNYFGKENTVTYDRGAVHPVDSQARFHKYAID